jgi:bifunctional non-homologous end joining protein LigD
MPARAILDEHHLYYQEGSSDKVYHIWIEQVGANNTVRYEYGRRGSTLQSEVKIRDTHHAKAAEILLRIVAEKLGKGYKNYDPKKGPPIPGSMAGVTTGPSTAPATGGSESPVAGVDMGGNSVGDRLETNKSVHLQLLNEIDEAHLKTLVVDNRWAFQEKFDGKRMALSMSPEGKVMAWNKMGKRIEPPREFCSVLQKEFAGFQFTIDGEACGKVFMAFDILEVEGNSCRDQSYEDRLVLLGMLMRSAKKQQVFKEAFTATSRKEKEWVVKELKKGGAEGVVAKFLDAPYRAGRPNSGGSALKFKFVASATCLVMLVNEKRSVQIAVRMGKDKITPVGSVAIPVNHEVPKVGDHIEVRYLYAYRGGSLYQPVYLGKRDDADVDDVSTLKFKKEENNE